MRAACGRLESPDVHAIRSRSSVDRHRGDDPQRLRFPGEQACVVRSDNPRPRPAAPERAEPVSLGSVIDVDGGDSLHDGACAVELVSYQREEVPYPVTPGCVNDASAAGSKQAFSAPVLCLLDLLFFFLYSLDEASKDGK
jgi:hypothetical protein